MLHLLSREEEPSVVLVGGETIDITTIGGRLRAARRFAGLSQVELLERAKVYLDKQAVSQWEHSRYVIHTPYLARICDALDISCDWLLGSSRAVAPEWLHELPIPSAMSDGVSRVFGSMPKMSPLPKGDGHGKVPEVRRKG